MDNAFQYVHDNKGIDDENSYPYVAKVSWFLLLVKTFLFCLLKDGAACKFRPPSVACTCDGFVDIPAGNEIALQEALAIHGPVSVAIDAGQSSFQFYSSGNHYLPF